MTPQDGSGPEQGHKLRRRVKGTFYYSKANHAKANSAAGGHASSSLPTQEAFVGSSSRYLGSSLIARPAPRTTVSVVWRPRLSSLGFRVRGSGFRASPWCAASPSFETAPPPNFKEEGGGGGVSARVRVNHELFSCTALWPTVSFFFPPAQHSLAVHPYHFSF